jgi:DNA-binding transcriptional LysR family regulator
MPDTRTLSLSKREADIALRMSRFEGHEVVARKVGTLALGLYGSPEWQDREGEEVRLITVLDDQAHLPEAKWLSEQFPQGEIAFRSNCREVQVWAAKSGAGITAIASYRADGEPGLVRLKPEVPNLTRDIWLGVHSDMRHMPRIRAVMDAIIDALVEAKAVLNPFDWVAGAARTKGKFQGQATAS